jgi:transposase
MNLSPLNCSVKMSPMRKRVTLTVEEQKRLKVIMEVDAGRMKAREAAEMLGLSLRHVRRLVAAYRKEGAASFAHGNRGRRSVHRISEEVRDRILELARGPYHDYNDTHFAEKLVEQHGILVSRSTVRRLRRSIGQGSPRKRRPPRHRSRRERYPLPGMLLQIDGSQHDWLEGRGPRLVLIAAIDDATNEVPYALFRYQEDAAGYFELMYAISQSHGLPLAVYADRHTIFQSPAKPTIEQQLSGELPRSQFGRLMHELAIESFAALSPQAKGRVERLFGTLQDRLVKELREAQASTLEEANRVLWAYLPSFNVRFALPPAQTGSAYRPWPEDLQPEPVFSFKHQRTVASDNTISFDGKRLQIPPSPKRISYARARVDVHQYLDGRLAICYNDEVLIIYQPATPDPVRVGKFTPAILPQPSSPKPDPQQEIPSPKPRKPYKPAPDHPWRRYPVAHGAR